MILDRPVTRVADTLIRVRRSRVLLGAAVAAAISLGSGRRDDPRFVTPPLATPTRFLEVRGTSAPGTKLDLFVNYQTTSKSCRVVIDRLAGVDSDRIYRHAVAVERTPEGFRAAVPLDLVAPGECGWRAWGIEYTAFVNGKVHAIPIAPTPLVWFREGAAASLSPIRIECGPQRGPRLPFSTAGDGPECDESGGGDRFVSPAASGLVVDLVRRSR